MQRPVMNPNFYEEAPTRSGWRFRPMHMVSTGIRWTLRRIFKFLTFDPFSHIVGFHAEEGTPTSRFLRGLFYRLAFVPVMIAATACAVVWTATHPRSVVGQSDPAWQNIYYEPVTFTGADQVSLEGWLVPVLNAKEVLIEKENVLKKRYPAVVLVHDQGQRREQMLPMIKPLHEAGFVVLAINLRGGTQRAIVGETFGLRESGDVKAAAELLRKRRYVDPKRVAVVGCGTGATAALLAADGDPQIAAVVADQPIRDAGDLIDNHLMPESRLLTWLKPLCKWTFEISYGVDMEDIELKNFSDVFSSRPVLMVDSSESHGAAADSRAIQQIATFLSASLSENRTATAAVADVKH